MSGIIPVVAGLILMVFAGVFIDRNMKRQTVTDKTMAAWCLLLGVLFIMLGIAVEGRA